MLNLAGNLKVFLAVEPTDLRKSFNGLYAQVTEVMKERPESGGLFVFSNRRRSLFTIM